ncbi:hypothetical protein SCP_0214380 [Sparassis crispa]|uniref:Uncharacterized protein n=1 Tax=Sparassis crispa TaxID=139825 RepID=A0A401GDG5_9APHY|nr:hypothetical protein SCP_0214380 [Sparassis crispa]GBE80228.1 hypothetical protein SCP_0214380 [Sparassis crispa]
MEIHALNAREQILKEIYSKLVEAVPQAVLLMNSEPSQPSNFPGSSDISGPRALSFSTSGGAPLCKSDYPGVRFWTFDEWNAYRKILIMEGGILQIPESINADHSTDEQQESEDRRSKKSNATKKKKTIRRALYLEDEHGETVSDNRAGEIRRVAREIWAQLWNEGHAPETWGAKTANVAAFYYKQMSLCCPELRLCHGDWKAERLAIDSYSQWRTTRSKGDEMKSASRSRSRAHSRAHSKRKARSASDMDSSEDDSQPTKRVKATMSSSTPSSNSISISNPTPDTVHSRESANPAVNVQSSSSSAVALISAIAITPAESGSPVANENDEELEYIDASLGLAGSACDPTTASGQRDDTDPGTHERQQTPIASTSVPTTARNPTNSMPLDPLADMFDMTPATAQTATTSTSAATVIPPASELPALTSGDIVTDSVRTAVPTMQLKKKKKSPKMFANSSSTASNLFAKDWLKTHEGESREQFQSAWEALESAERKMYEDRSAATIAALKAEKAAAKRAEKAAKVSGKKKAGQVTLPASAGTKKVLGSIQV